MSRWSTATANLFLLSCSRVNIESRYMFACEYLKRWQPNLAARARASSFPLLNLCTWASESLRNRSVNNCISTSLQTPSPCDKVRRIQCITIHIIGEYLRTLSRSSARISSCEQSQCMYGCPPTGMQTQLLESNTGYSESESRPPILMCLHRLYRLALLFTHRHIKRRYM
jgi:hypothetical protein